MAPFWRKFPLPQTWRLRLELRSLYRFYGQLESKAKTEQERRDPLGEMSAQTDPLEEGLEVGLSIRSPTIALVHEGKTVP